jgi:hypothetical protein
VRGGYRCWERQQVAGGAGSDKRKQQDTMGQVASNRLVRRGDKVSGVGSAKEIRRRGYRCWERRWVAGEGGSGKMRTQDAMGINSQAAALNGVLQCRFGVVGDRFD